LGLFKRTFDEIIKACVPQLVHVSQKSLEVEKHGEPSMEEAYDFKATF